MRQQNATPFVYELPRERIAQRPVERDKAKLLRARLSEGSLALSDHVFCDLPGLLRRGDLLILNDSAVEPCRFFLTAGGRTVEVFILRKNGGEYEALASPMEKLKTGMVFALSEDLRAEVLGRSDDGRRLRLKLASAASTVEEAIRRAALMPIPPYIRGGRSDAEDRKEYQTVYAKTPGSIAAPTAGLHFTPELLSQLESSGVRIGYLTLHVGTASFIAAEKQDPALQRTEAEQYCVPAETARLIAETKMSGGRVVAVGTTAVRALESYARLADPAPGVMHTSELFIRPPFVFMAADALITNFHQPGSTHLFLVSAVMGAETMKQIYEYAMEGDYRFLSYGDAMLLERG